MNWLTFHKRLLRKKGGRGEKLVFFIMPIVEIADNLMSKGFESNEKLIYLPVLEKSPVKRIIFRLAFVNTC
jgi:hypothetical protein